MTTPRLRILLAACVATPLLVATMACGTGAAPQTDPAEAEAFAEAQEAARAEAVTEVTSENQGVVEPAQPPAEGTPRGAARAACPDFVGRTGSVPGVRIGRADLGDRWPLTVEEGCLHCEEGTQAVLFVVDERTYQVNGAAASLYRGQVEDLEGVWAENHSIPGTRVNVGPLLEQGLALCR